MQEVPTSHFGEEKGMKSVLSTAAVVVAILAAVAGLAEQSKKGIVGLRPDEIRWYVPSYYTDGRQRAQLFGDSNQEGAWVDRVKIPSALRVPAHTHPQDEFVTVMEGTWYLGEGEQTDPAKLRAYPAGSFIVIPAGVPHFVATRDSPVVIQLSGTHKFKTDFLEK
jgi:quercetin dioxygenase-like cupin family protein